jgi:tetratricopeptide (TPR) repeat protein
VTTPPTPAGIDASVVGRPGRRRAWWRVAAPAAALAVVAAGALAPRVSRPPARALPLAVDAAPAVAVAGAPSTTPLSESERRDRNIALFAAAVEQDPASAHFRAQLALQYLQRGRETGSVADVEHAERAARASLAQRTQHNGAAFATLVEALLEQHRFAEAGQIARQLVAGDPDVPVYRAMLGEVELELGNYAEAAHAFSAVPRDRSSLANATRLARLAEIRGDTAAARAGLAHAAAAAYVDGTLPSEQRAWFQLRVGEYQLRHGALAAADSAFRRGLAVAPEDYRLLGAMARLRAVQHDWRSAIEYGDQAIAIVLDPATVGLVGDAYAALGDSAKSAEYVRTMEVAVRQQPGAYHRAWSLFLLDRGLRVSEVHANVRTELRTRPDIYGHDLLGWALYKRGRHAEARVHMAQAMAQGTQDALLFYHAGVVERAAGDAGRAAELLRRALAVNPYFHPTHPAAARATLDSLARGDG